MRLIHLPLLAALLVLLAPPVRAAEPIGIVAAESVYGEVAASVGGTHVTVTSVLANPDADPHLFETGASAARAVAEAAIVVYNGAGYDAWMEKLLAAAPSPSRTAIVAADLIGRKPGENPHVWYAPATLPAVARAIAAELTRRDPADAADFAAGAQAFEASLAPVAARIARIRAAHQGLAVTATEPVFGDMAEALGFRMLNESFQRAVMNETEPSPAEIAGFERSLKSGEAKLLFYNAQVADDTSARLLAIARAAHVPVVAVTETAPAGKSVVAWFGDELAAIEDALK
jgi:zinc/manganese transport system substrate-binding protein